MSTERTHAWQKAAAMLGELVGGQGVEPAAANSVYAGIVTALTQEHGAERSADIAFHLTDWAADAAFLVALQLFPDRFTQDEIREGILGFLIHVPNHVAAAAQLAGWPLRDVFEVGVTVEP